MREKIALWVKGILTACSYVFLFAIALWDPANIITFTGETVSAYDDRAKAAGYALLAATSIAIHRMPTQENQ